MLIPAFFLFPPAHRAGPPHQVIGVAIIPNNDTLHFSSAPVMGANCSNFPFLQLCFHNSSPSARLAGSAAAVIILLISPSERLELFPRRAGLKISGISPHRVAASHLVQK
jgi:hypothetical protein